RDVAVQSRPVILARCHALRVTLRRRVAQVTVRVSEPRLPGLRVRVAGMELRESLYNVPYLVAPGRVSVEAWAPGRAPFRTDAAVEAGGATEVNVWLDPVRASTSAAHRAALDATGARGSS